MGAYSFRKSNGSKAEGKTGVELVKEFKQDADAFFEQFPYVFPAKTKILRDPHVSEPIHDEGQVVIREDRFAVRYSVNSELSTGKSFIHMLVHAPEDQSDRAEQALISSAREALPFWNTYDELTSPAERSFHEFDLEALTATLNDYFSTLGMAVATADVEAEEYRPSALD